MTNQIWIRLTMRSRAVLLLASAVAVSTPVTVDLLHGQSAVTARPSFEVASVKRNNSEGPGTQHWGPQEVYLSRADLLATIAEAYQTPYTRISVPKDSTSQGLLRTNYDIAATAAHKTSKSELLVMLQSLFEDRFKLAVHHESKTEDVYQLVIAKGGPKFQESKTEGPASGSFIPGGYAVKNSEMWRFCAFLSGRMGRPIADQTSLAGIYDFTLRLDSLEGLSSSDPDFKAKISDWSSSSIFSDIQKQLGLRLVSAKAPVDYLVIDHVEKPSEN